MNRRKKISIIVVLTFLFLYGWTLVSGGGDSKASSVENIELRFVFTTDLHGRLTTTNFEQNKSFETGSLAKAATMIKNAKNEKFEGNTFTFDVGDVLYDYTTETIFEMDPDSVQPIYKALASMDYDAITLGNHEFEYGYDYLMKQMNQSGLSDICVVSNLKDAKTGRTAFRKNMLISRKVKTNSGTTTTVKIGVIGETIPTLSKKRENYTGTFLTEDIVKNATAEAKALKARGADVIVVLAHSGFGVENPPELSSDVSYALTKIPEVDVVLCGHEHKTFPSNDLDSAIFYTNAGVDKKTGLVNGKNLVMASDKGQSIGVVDVTVKKAAGSTSKIVDRESQVRKVASYTAANPEINKGYDDWKQIFTASTKNILGNVASGYSINNYFGLVEDTNSMQLVNNAMIHYAMQYVNNAGKQYKNYPIIAASNHAQFGQYQDDDFVNISGQISEYNMSSIATFHRNLYLYEITGKQLKEWLEWSASAYEQVDKTSKWNDATMNKMIEASGAQSLLAEDWFNEWGSFYVFDGVEYIINPSVEPRYNCLGEIVNQTSRVVSLTYNGVPVTDNMKFVLATQSLVGLNYYPLNSITSQLIYKKSNHRLTVLMEYVEDLCDVEDLVPTVDNNWHLGLPKDKDFILKLSKRATFHNENWTYDVIDTVNPYTYYKVRYQSDTIDKDSPNVVVASTNEAKTNNDVNIAVNATDPSGIKEIKYLYGNYGPESYNWVNGEVIPDNHIFTVTSNGIYTVYALDNAGNATVSKIKVDNISREILQVPTVNTYSNRMSNITGMAEPGAEIYFITVDGIYHNQVKEDGTFSYPLPQQLANNTVSVYVEDKYGRRSDRVTIKVKRTGPNYPEIAGINNNDIKITGNTHDDIKTVFAVVGSKVYVSSKGGVSAYQSCEKYNDSKTIVTTSVSVGSDGSFSLAIPAQRSSTSITVYALDYVGRVSKANKLRVAHVAPNPPTIYAVCNGENEIHGRIYSTTSGVVYNVTIQVNGISYETVTDENGYYSSLVGNLKVGQTISVVATDTVDNVTRNSAKIQSKVRDIKQYIATDDDKYVTVNKVTDKTEKITGQCEDGKVKVTLKVDNEIIQIDTDEDGYFEYPLSKKLEIGTKISAVVRQEHGGIEGADMGSVVLGRPYQPILINPAIYNSTRIVKIASSEECSITMKVGNETYTTQDYEYDQETKSYVFQLLIKNVNSGNPVDIYATNAAGNSSKLSLRVLQKAPNTPKTETVDTDAKTIIGTVQLLLKADEGTDTKTPTVENTGTKVYAKIGSKTYRAVIKDDGTFVIKIPKQKKGKSIRIWAENSQGIGPSKIIKVYQAKK